MSLISLIVLLYAVGLLLVVLDVLIIPTHIAGAIGSLMTVAGIVLMFRFAPVWVGIGAIALTSVTAVALVRVAGYRYSLAHEQRKDEGYIATDPTLPALRGRAGVAVTVLRPAGKVQIADRRVDVVTRGEMIDPGTQVVVIEVEGNRVVVKPAPADGSGGEAEATAS